MPERRWAWPRTSIFPGIPVAVAVAATMGGAMVATMKAPIFSALFVMVLVQPETSPVIAIAVIVGTLATARVSMVFGAREASGIRWCAETRSARAVSIFRAVNSFQ